MSEEVVHVKHGKGLCGFQIYAPDRPALSGITDVLALEGPVMLNSGNCSQTLDSLRTNNLSRHHGNCVTARVGELPSQSKLRLLLVSQADLRHCSSQAAH